MLSLIAIAAVAHFVLDPFVFNRCQELTDVDIVCNYVVGVDAGSMCCESIELQNLMDKRKCTRIFADSNIKMGCDILLTMNSEDIAWCCNEFTFPTNYPDTDDIFDL